MTEIERATAAALPSPAPVAVYFGQVLNGRRLHLGTRTSPMAMAQAHRVRDLLAGQVDGLDVEVVGIQTSGDVWRGDLAMLGGKGAFLKEIDKALLMGRIDIAVHCLKDVPGDVPLAVGTVIAAYLPREDVHDVVVFPEGSKCGSLAELPPGSKVATSAVRRKAQLLRARPDLHVDRIRGNVNTRLARLDAEQRWDAMILARAGLRRIGMEHRVGQVLSLEEMCPAVGAGIITLHTRADDEAAVELARLLDDPATRVHATAERTMLHGLQGHCNSPVAGALHDHARRTAVPDRDGVLARGR
ncbi:UNVERIFIED_ORG: hydroxymethylbilane synthase, partial [Actinomadura viridilutea]